MHLVIRYGDLALVGATGEEKKNKSHTLGTDMLGVLFYFLSYFDIFSFPSLRGIQGIWWYRFFFFSAAFDMSRDGMR